MINNKLLLSSHTHDEVWYLGYHFNNAASTLTYDSSTGNVFYRTSDGGYVGPTLTGIYQYGMVMDGTVEYPIQYAVKGWYQTYSGTSPVKLSNSSIYLGLYNNATTASYASGIEQIGLSNTLVSGSMTESTLLSSSYFDWNNSTTHVIAADSTSAEDNITGGLTVSTTAEAVQTAASSFSYYYGGYTPDQVTSEYEDHYDSSSGEDDGVLITHYYTTLIAGSLDDVPVFYGFDRYYLIAIWKSWASGRSSLTAQVNSVGNILVNGQLSPVLWMNTASVSLS